MKNHHTFRVLPHRVEAFQLPQLEDDVEPFMEWAARVEFDGYSIERDGCMNIDTSAGLLTAEPGDWIVKMVTGEFMPFKPTAFRAAFIHSNASAPNAADASLSDYSLRRMWFWTQKPCASLPGFIEFTHSILRGGRND